MRTASRILPAGFEKLNLLTS